MITSGATLQHDRYLLESLLEQSEIGMTYSAKHIHLDQLVLVQTLHEGLKQRSDFAQIRQQFLARVRQAAMVGADSTVQVLDCFEEDGLPYVVLTPVAPPPPLSNWVTPPQPEAEAIDESKVDESKSKTVLQPAEPTQLQLEPQLEPQSEPQASDHLVPAIAPDVTQPVADPYQPVLPRSPYRGPRKRVILPVMAMTAIVAGLVGAGVGMAMRLNAIQDMTTPSQQPERRSGLFNREQAFPPSDNWPGTKYPDPPEPVVEQPLYRSNPIEPNYPVQSLPQRPRTLAQPTPPDPFSEPAAIEPTPAILPDAEVAPPRTQPEPAKIAPSPRPLPPLPEPDPPAAATPAPAPEPAPPIELPPVAPRKSLTANPPRVVNQ